MSRLFHLERLEKRVKNLSGEDRIDGEPGHCGGGIGSSSEKKKRRRPANEDKGEANKQQKITANNVLEVFLSAAEKVAVDALVRKGGMEEVLCAGLSSLRSSEPALRTYARRLRFSIRTD
ncbi:hypothetical protein FGB62_140g119 [Gracilaria domingensis]|nr:hypothetical protein FGB62_140g119 [Gracilaria domingensis]